MNKPNLILGALMAIAATLRYPVSRLQAAKLNVRKKLGYVPEGTGRYHAVCPKGAGHGPAARPLADKGQVGSRAFTRRQRRFIKNNYELNRTLNT